MVHQLLPKNAIYLDSEVQERYSTVSLGSDSNLINFGKLKDFQLICFHCGDHNIAHHNIAHHNIAYEGKPFSWSCVPYIWYRCDSLKHFFCKLCFHPNRTCLDLERIRSKDVEVDSQLNFYQVSPFEGIKFECKWPACKQIFGCSTLKEHEISCPMQLKRKCPVHYCTWYGRLDELENEHFKTHENSKLIYRNEVKDLKPDKNFYLLILDQFVLVQYAVKPLGEVFQHDFNLKLCSEELSLVKPVGLVTTFDKILVKKIKEGDHSAKSFRAQVVLFVYLEDL